jgi:phosphoenolpyruvate synthase/pyruvate phosphate dikinase
MEDLKEFTGAGLNLTLFNVVEKDKIIQGIKDVWASPYTERSYKWRQSYLLNPENVYPSILVIPSVDVDYSGVLITKGILNDKEEDMTIAFSRGAGGAVDGQAAESYLLQANGDNVLVSPSREPNYNKLPLSGGIIKTYATFEQPILSSQNLKQVREFSLQVKSQMASGKNTQSKGPHDIELGFKDHKIYLFQIRPFVENKNALRSEYLKSITPVLPVGRTLILNTPL